MTAALTLVQLVTAVVSLAGATLSVVALLPARRRRGARSAGRRRQR